MSRKLKIVQNDAGTAAPRQMDFTPRPDPQVPRRLELHARGWSPGLARTGRAAPQVHPSHMGLTRAR
jgi:hypothetical protein